MHNEVHMKCTILSVLKGFFALTDVECVCTLRWSPCQWLHIQYIGFCFIIVLLSLSWHMLHMLSLIQYDRQALLDVGASIGMDIFGLPEYDLKTLSSSGRSAVYQHAAGGRRRRRREANVVEFYGDPG